MEERDIKQKRRKAVRTALVLAAIALAFFVASFIFVPR